MAQGLLVRVALEGTEQAIICKEMKPDPMLEGNVLLSGMMGLMIQGTLQVEVLSVRKADIKFYAAVNQMQQPGAKPPTEPPAPPASHPDNGQAPAAEAAPEEPKRKPGRPAKRPPPADA